MERILKEKLPEGRFRATSGTRRALMSKIRGRGNKSTEVRLRLALVRRGISGWILQPKGLIGNPDFYFPDHRLVIFVDGCYWHGCRRCGHIPKCHSEFWRAKITRTRQRDRSAGNKLFKMGFSVIRIWEHELLWDIKLAVNRIEALVGSV